MADDESGRTLKDAARERGLKFVSGDAFTIVGGYVGILSVGSAWKRGAAQERDWSAAIKPMAVDEVLWEAFLPDVAMTPQVKLNRRINGAFQVTPLTIASAPVPTTADGGTDWDAIITAFERAVETFVAEHPDRADYVTALEEDTSTWNSGVKLVRTLTAQIAAGQRADAVALADDAIGRGESGPMSSSVDILKYLRAFAAGPEAYAAFQKSLVPTHSWQVITSGDTRTRPAELAREHHAGAFGRDLSALDGTNRWAVVLDTLPEDPDSPPTMSYLQAAGSADAMTIELCRPVDRVDEVTAIRSIVSRTPVDSARTAGVQLPPGVERVSPTEVFAAEEATAMFTSFYRNGSIGEEYALRPVEEFFTRDGVAGSRAVDADEPARHLTFEDDQERKVEWRTGDPEDADDVFIAFVEEHLADDNARFTIQDAGDKDEALVLFFDLQVAARGRQIDGEQEVEYLPADGEKSSDLADAFIVGGYEALDAFGPFLPDVETIQEYLNAPENQPEFSLSGPPLVFTDRNLKLAVIEELMYVQELLRPPFDLDDFIEAGGITSIREPWDAEQPILEVLAWFENLEIPSGLAPAIKELYVDGGNEVYMAICPQWTGEDDWFDIHDFTDLELFPNLKKMTLIASADDLAMLRARGIDAEEL